MINSYNMDKVINNLKDRDIIYSIQYISNEETEIDADGPTSCYNITILCIEKEKSDYIFHFNFSDYIRSYSYPSIICIDKFTLSSIKLSDLKNQINTISEKSPDYIYKFIQYWENNYSKIFGVSDENLKSEMMILQTKIDDITVY
jgi:hypothetical protein